MRKKVMIVDDDRELLEELTASLLMDDYEVISVNNPHKALDEAIKTRPDIVLLDITMPQKSGFQVASEIMYFSYLSDTSIIVMTGSFKERYEALTHICGFKGLLKKPFCYPDLLCKIKSVEN